MSNSLYRNIEMEQKLLNKINLSANRRWGRKIPATVQERLDTEIGHIFASGYGTLFAVAADLAEHSADLGYPVGIRGLVGDLLIAHLLGLGAVDPLELGLHWEGCLGPDGSRMPGITLNIAEEVLNDLRAHLADILPECDVLFGPGIARWKVLIIPRASGAYDPANEYLELTLIPHELMSRMGEVRRRTPDEFLANEALIISAYRGDVGDIPVLSDLADFQDLANLLRPKTFADLVKVMGLCLAWPIQFQAYRAPLLPDRFNHIVGTREDIYDICVQHGVSEADAFRVMEQVVRGELTPGDRDMLAARGLPGVFLEVLDKADYLYPRGQCADYLFWALNLLARRHQPCRV